MRNIANIEEKIKIEEILKLNDTKLEIEKQKKYNVDELFKNETKKQGTSLIDVSQKEKWYIKIYTFIKRVWLIKKER